jgi:excisionase family DNA binding protein
LINNTGTGAFVETYLSIESLAKYLDVAEKTMRKWVLNHDIPYRKIHKLIRFRLSEIERWIENGGKMPLLNDEAGSADGAAI